MIKIIEPRFSEEEKNLILEILESNIVTRGEYTQKFHEAFANYLGVKHVFSVCSGTVALFVALKALNVENKKVVVPAMSFMATIDAVILAGGIPIVIDVDEYYTMDVEQLETAAKRYNPKVVIPVHLYGQSAQMDSIMQLSEKYGFYVLEDAAQAHGAMYKDRKVGSIGHMGAFSFYASKNVPMGEGGAIVTNDDNLAREIKKWIDFGDHPAFNLRITEFQAALGLVQLKHLDERNSIRRNIAQKYSQELFNLYKIPSERPSSYHVYHLYTLRHPDRDRILELLRSSGVDARVYYTYLLNELRGAEYISTERASKFKQEVFSIPVHPYLTNEQIDYIVERLKAFALAEAV